MSDCNTFSETWKTLVKDKEDLQSSVDRNQDILKDKHFSNKIIVRLKLCLLQIAKLLNVIKLNRNAGSKWPLDLTRCLLRLI